MIDALDEAGEAGRNPLVEMLARHASLLPDWLGLIVTSRPESHVTMPLHSEKPVLLDKASDNNIADLRELLLHRLAPQLAGRADADRLISQILQKSEGVILYIEGFLRRCPKRLLFDGSPGGVSDRAWRKIRSRFQTLFPRPG